MSLTLKINEVSTGLLVESLLKNLEEKNKRLVELEAANHDNNYLEKMYKVQSTALAVLTDYLEQHHENLPQLVEYAKKTAVGNEYEYTEEGSYQAVAWYLELDENEKNLADFQWFQRNIASKK